MVKQSQVFMVTLGSADSKVIPSTQAVGASYYLVDVEAYTAPRVEPHTAPHVEPYTVLHVEPHTAPCVEPQTAPRNHHDLIRRTTTSKGYI